MCLSKNNRRAGLLTDAQQENTFSKMLAEHSQSYLVKLCFRHVITSSSTYCVRELVIFLPPLPPDI